MRLPTVNKTPRPSFGRSSQEPRSGYLTGNFEVDPRPTGRCASAPRNLHHRRYDASPVVGRRPGIRPLLPGPGIRSACRAKPPASSREWNPVCAEILNVRPRRIRTDHECARDGAVVDPASNSSTWRSRAVSCEILRSASPLDVGAPGATRGAFPASVQGSGPRRDAPPECLRGGRRSPSPS